MKVMKKQRKNIFMNCKQLNSKSYGQNPSKCLVIRLITFAGLFTTGGVKKTASVISLGDTQARFCIITEQCNYTALAVNVWLFSSLHCHMVEPQTFEIIWTGITNKNHTSTRRKQGAWVIIYCIHNVYITQALYFLILC